MKNGVDERFLLSVFNQNIFVEFHYMTRLTPWLAAWRSG